MKRIVVHWLVHAIDIAAESELKEGFELNDTLDKLNDIRTEILENIIQCDESPPLEDSSPEKEV